MKDNRGHRQSGRPLRAAMVFSFWGDPTWRLSNGPSKPPESNRVHAIRRGRKLEIHVPKSWPEEVHVVGYHARIPLGGTLSGVYSEKPAPVAEKQLVPQYFTVVPMEDWQPRTSLVVQQASRVPLDQSVGPAQPLVVSPRLGPLGVRSRPGKNVFVRDPLIGLPLFEAEPVVDFEREHGPCGAADTPASCAMPAPCARLPRTAGVLLVGEQRVADYAVPLVPRLTAGLEHGQSAVVQEVVVGGLCVPGRLSGEIVGGLRHERGMRRVQEELLVEHAHANHGVTAMAGGLI